MYMSHLICLLEIIKSEASSNTISKRHTIKDICISITDYQIFPKKLFYQDSIVAKKKQKKWVTTMPMIIVFH